MSGKQTHPNCSAHPNQYFFNNLPILPRTLKAWLSLAFLPSPHPSTLHLVPLGIFFLLSLRLKGTHTFELIN